MDQYLDATLIHFRTVSALRAQKKAPRSAGLSLNGGSFAAVASADGVW